jgi:hypothetical protein
VHEDLIAHGLVVEELARLGVRRAQQPAEQVRLLPERGGVDPGPDQRVGRPITEMPPPREWASWAKKLISSTRSLVRTP